jgi:hypothetical protein
VLAWDGAAYLGSCDRIVPCLAPDTFAGQFDVSSCAGVPSGSSCQITCAPGTVGDPRTWLCPALNTNASKVAEGVYPPMCQATWMTSDAGEKTSLLQARLLMGSPPALEPDANELGGWIPATDPCVDKWHGVSCDYLTGRVISLNLRRQNLPPSNGQKSLPIPICRNLPQLRHINLHDNAFRGTIPFQVNHANMV